MATMTVMMGDDDDDDDGDPDKKDLSEVCVLCKKRHPETLQ